MKAKIFDLIRRYAPLLLAKWRERQNRRPKR